MAKGNVASEPSMEEILASIRRIIADEEPGQSAKRDEFIPEPLPDEGDDYGASQPIHSSSDVLDLGTAEEEASSIPAKALPTIDVDDISFDGADDTPAPAPPPVRQQPAPQASKPKQNEWSETVNRAAPRPQAPPPQQNYAPQPSGGLTSAHTGAAVSAAFNSLANSIFSNEPRTIEDLTKDMLRPLLKQWLDDNLPSLVERIVRDEIERVARGR